LKESQTVYFISSSDDANFNQVGWKKMAVQVAVVQVRWWQMAVYSGAQCVAQSVSRPHSWTVCTHEWNKKSAKKKISILQRGNLPQMDRYQFLHPSQTSITISHHAYGSSSKTAA
jgi:hypothetical protein